MFFASVTSGTSSFFFLCQPPSFTFIYEVTFAKFFWPHMQSLWNCSNFIISSGSSFNSISIWFESCRVICTMWSMFLSYCTDMACFYFLPQYLNVFSCMRYDTFLPNSVKVTWSPLVISTACPKVHRQKEAFKVKTPSWPISWINEVVFGG